MTENVAPTVCACVIFTVHAPVPVQAQFHPVKREPESATGVRVTVVPLRNGEEQDDPLVPHEIPAGEDVRVPDPVGTTERVWLVGGGGGGGGVLDPHTPDDPPHPEDPHQEEEEEEEEEEVHDDVHDDEIVAEVLFSSTGAELNNTSCIMFVVFCTIQLLAYWYSC